MTEIYLHIVARMADYMDTHPYRVGFHAPAIAELSFEVAELRLGLLERRL